MLENDVLLSKASIVRRCLDRIDATVQGNLDSVDDFDKQDIVVLNLQRAIQACIDAANVVVSVKSLGLPSTYAQSFDLVVRAGLLDVGLGASLKRMVGFRNIAVHEYRELDVAILKRVVAHHLSDLADFAVVIHGWVMGGLHGQ